MKRAPGLVVIFAVSYPLALLAVLLAFRFIGERWWLTTVGLYLPRWPLALPLPLLSFLIVRLRRRLLFLSPVLSTFLLLFPIAGLRVGRTRSAEVGKPTLRVLTFNIQFARDPTALLATLRSTNADIVLLQEAAGRPAGWWKHELPAYAWSVDGQFVMGSRYPVADVTVPAPNTYHALDALPRYVRYRVVLPDVQVSVYSIHPASPSSAFAGLRADAFHASGGWRRGWPNDDDISAIESNAARRVAVLQAVIADARRSDSPAIIAGDSNVPDLGRAASRVFAGFRDAFAEVGNGFGYTFPVDEPTGPWMRIDRILTNDWLHVLGARVLPAAGSDHLAVVADLQRR